MTTKKDLPKEEKEKKDKFLQTCMDSRRKLNPLVYSDGVIPIMEKWSEEKILASHLNFKIKWEYSKMCGFVQARM